MTTSTNQQRWNPSQYAQQARFVSDLGSAVVDLLAPQPGERILDLGCGDGALTKTLVDAGCQVVGVDASPEMVAAAGELGLDAQRMDGHELQFEQEFDAVFTNAALHWMKQPERVLAGVWRALKPGGRFVGEFGGGGNVATICSALESALAERGIAAKAINPWFFPGEEDYCILLKRHGFEVITANVFPRPTPLPTDVLGWLKTFAQPFTAVLPEEQREGFLADVAERCRPVLCGNDGHWVADYVRLRFAAIKPCTAEGFTSGA